MKKYFLLVILLVFLVPLNAYSETGTISAKIDKSFYREGDIITISGTITPPGGTSIDMLIINENTGKIVTIGEIYAKGLEPNQTFSYSVNAKGPLWLDGPHKIQLSSSGGRTTSIQFEFESTKDTSIQTNVPYSGTEHNIIMTEDLHNPECAIHDTCVIPSELFIAPGDWVLLQWNTHNCGGLCQPIAGTRENGPNGNYTINQKFNTEGYYPFFIMVKPWVEFAIVVTDKKIDQTPKITEQEEKLEERITEIQNETLDAQLKHSENRIEELEKTISNLQNQILDLKFDNAELRAVLQSLGSNTDDVSYSKDSPKSIAPFVDPTKDPQHYIDRYNNEPEYKRWFDENYPDYDSIEQAVGLKLTKKIPEWVQNTALWYGQGLISEDEFLNAIEYLINQGIIKVVR